MFRSLKAIKFVALFAVLWSSLAFAWPPTFGDELNFTNEKIEKAWAKQENKSWVNNPENEAARDAFAKVVKESCGDCKVSAKKDKYGNRIWKVTYSDGWFFQIAVDPAVVEIQVAGTTVEKMKSIKDRINRDIFEAAKKIGLTKEAGGDHMHVGKNSALENDLMLFRNSLVSYANHPEVGGYFFSQDVYNAPVLSLATKAQREAFEKVINEVDAGKIKSIEELATRIVEEVYFRTTLPSWTPPEKYQSTNLSRIGNPHFREEEQTYERRSLPSLKSAEDMILHAELEQNELKRLKTLEGPIPINIPNLKTMTDREKFEAFHQFITEAGMNFEDFKKYLTGGMKMMKPQRRTRTDLDIRMCKDVYGKSLSPPLSSKPR